MTSDGRSLVKFTGSNEDVREGDFILRDGFRRVCSAKPVVVSTGRGSKKVSRTIATTITYVDGTSVELLHGELHPKTHQPFRISIYRPSEVAT